MTTYIVDASVAVKWFLREEHSPIAIRLLESEHSLIAPSLLHTEVANAMWKRVRRSELSIEDARTHVEQLATVVSLASISGGVAQALEIAIRFSTTVYDSLYVAFAQQLQCQLVTADRRLHNALQAHLPETMVWIEDVPDAG